MHTTYGVDIHGCYYILIIPLLYSIFRDKINANENEKGDCRWRTAANGKIVDESSAGYKETNVIA